MTTPDAAALSEHDWAPTSPEMVWTALDLEAKHERILCAAGRVFSTQGLDAPMPAVAAEAGTGVATIYRHFPSKQELLAALVTRRLKFIAVEATAAARRPGDRWTALTEMLRTVVTRHQGDDFVGEAWALVHDRPGVDDAGTEATAAIGRLLDDARREGRLRADATTADIRLLFTATRAARQIAPGGWERMLELFIDGLDSRRT